MKDKDSVLYFAALHQHNIINRKVTTGIKSTNKIKLKKKL